MPLTEAMLDTRYWHSDECALAKLQGVTLPSDRAQAEIDRLTEQLHHAARINCILEQQTKSAQAEAKKWRGRYNDLAKRQQQVRRDAMRSVPSSPEPRSYAERMRMKRF
jgi:hypothetical protein